jgi:hypothetical protein
MKKVPVRIDSVKKRKREEQEHKWHDVAPGAIFGCTEGLFTILSVKKCIARVKYHEYDGEWTLSKKDFAHPDKVWEIKEDHKKLKTGKYQSAYGIVHLVRVYGDGDVEVKMGDDIFKMSEEELQEILKGYNTNIKTRESKQLANAIFASLCIARVATQGDCNAVYLEGPDANTSCILGKMANNIRRTAVNFSPADCKSIANICDAVTIFPGSLNEALQEQIAPAVLWFDYCSTFIGNATTIPKADIQMALDRRIVDTYAAFTFCLRDPRMSSSESIIAEVLTMFRTAYPEVHTICSFTYWPSMVFFVIRLEQ